MPVTVKDPDVPVTILVSGRGDFPLCIADGAGNLDDALGRGNELRLLQIGLSRFPKGIPAVVAKDHDP